jgi:hypothetical protein
MEIKKFEAYNYKGPTLKSVNRKQFIELLIDELTDAKIGDYESNGTSYNLKDEILYLFMDKKVGDKYVDDLVVSLDLSDLGIEIGMMEWDDDKEDFKEFVPEINLDSDVTKQLKRIKKDSKKFNL